MLPILLLLCSGSIFGQTTVSHTFAATSGTIDSNISFTTQVNSASTAPAFNTGDSTLRLYYSAASPYNGGSITLVPSNGATITAVELTGVSGSTPTMRYSIGSATATTTDPVLTLAGVVYSVSGLSVTSSLKIRNANTSNTQARFTGIKVTYTSAGPTITSTATALTGFSATPSSPSGQQTFNVSGSSLTNNISVGPQTNYEISTTSGSGFTSSAIVLPQTSGVVPVTAIYVRLKSGLAIGAYNGEVINITSSGASAKTVTLSGDVIRNTITSATSGAWSSGATWTGGVAPTSADNVVIAAGHTVSLASAVTRDSGVTTTVNGTFQLNSGGYASGALFNYASTGSSLVFNSGSVYGVGSGNAFWPVSNSPYNVTVNAGSGAQLNTSVGGVAGVLTLNGQLDTPNNITVTGTLQLNAGGYVTSNAPIYGAASTLLYNTGYGVGTEWTGAGTTAGAGIPNNVTIQNNAAVTFSGSARGMAGNLNIVSGSLTSGDVLNVKGTTANFGTLTTNSTANFTGTVTNSGTFNANGVSNLSGNFSNALSGSVLTLGGDFKLAGNWSNAGTFTPNGRAVFFVGTGATQTITNSNTANGNTETFNYLVINNSNAAGVVRLASNVVVNSTTGDVLQLINSSSLDIAGKTLTLSNDGGNILASGGVRNITSSTSNGVLAIAGNKTVVSATSGTLVLGTSANPSYLTTDLTKGLNFGAGNLTTVNGVLQIKTNGYADVNTPKYGSSSSLIYNGVSGYNANVEWIGNANTAGVGVPQNVTLTNASVNLPVGARGLAGTLNIGTSSTLNLQATSGSDLSIGGDFTKTGTFNTNNRAVIFNGADGNDQNINNAQDFDYLIINKTGTGSVVLKANITVQKDLTLTNKSITLAGFNLTIPNKTSLITANSNSYINATGAGKLIRQNIDNTAEYIFPMGVAATNRYAPITFKNISTATEIGVNVNTTFSSAPSDATKTLKTEWRVTSTNPVTANLKADWTATEQGTNMVNPGTGHLGIFVSGTGYTLYDVTLAQYTTEATAVSFAPTAVNAIVIGNREAISLGNDECSGAYNVVVDAAAISGTNQGATTSLSPTCGGAVANDVWYKFTTTEAGNYKIDVTGATSFDAILNLRSGICNGTSLACADVSGSGGTETITQLLAANTVYYFRVYRFSGSATPTFTVAVSSVPTLQVAPTSINFGDVSVSADSASQSFSLSGSLLKSYPGNILVNAPAGFQISLDNATWASSLNVPFATGTLASVPVYSRVVSTATCGLITGNITFSGGGVVTAPTVSLSANAVVLAPTATAATDITATTFQAHWNAVAGATSYLLDVYTKGLVTTTVLNATFDDVVGTGGNSGGWSGSIATGTIPSAYTTAGWSFVSAGGADKSIKAGSGSSLGSVTTPELAVNSSGTLTFRAGAWDGTSENTILKLSATNATLSAATVTMIKGSFSTYSVNITGATGNVKITFTGNSASNSRFFIDDIKVTTSGLGNIPVSGYAPKTISGSSTTSGLVSALSQNTQYYYTVKAANATCESAKSSEIEVTTNNSVVWNAGVWSNTAGPDGTLDGIIRSSMYVGNAGQSDFTVKNLTIENTGLLKIKSEHGITVAGDISAPDNKIIIESDASLTQTKILNGNTINKAEVKRNVNMRKSDYTYWSAPVSDQVLLNTSNPNAANSSGGFSEGSPNNRTYEYNEVNDTFKATLDAKFLSGKGYAIRGKESYGTGLKLDSLKFAGVLHNGDYSVAVQKSKNTTSGGTPYEHGYNLIGNPYPSNIDFIKFYNLDKGNGTKNSDVIFGKAWFWTNVPGAPATQAGSSYTPNNYATITLAGGASPTSVQSATGTPIPNEFIKVSQGFIVQMRTAPPTGSIPTAGSLKFDNSIRTNNATGHFYNSSKTSDNEINRFWVNLVSPYNIVNTILIAHMDGASNSYDADYDADLLSVGDDSFYSKLNTQKLQIQARSNPLSYDDIIPLGSKYSVSGNYKITLGNKEGVFAENQKIYLLDKLTNTYTDLTVKDYAFTASKGTDETRFEIVYRENATLSTDHITKSDFEVYKDGQVFVIRSSNNLGKVELYSASGILVNTRSTSQKEIRWDTSSLPSGVYIIKAENSGSVRTKKIIR